MDKEKLLERSRQENKKGDEREIRYMDRAQSMGTFTVVAVLIFLIVLDYVTESGLGGIVSVAGVEFPFRDFCNLLLCLSLAVEFLYKAVFIRKKWQMVLAAFFTYGFCMGIYHVFLAG